MEKQAKIKTWLAFILLLVASVGLVIAIDFTPKADINLQNRYRIVNGTNATFEILSGNLSWANLSNYPAACPTGTSITQLGDTVTCTASGAKNVSEVSIYPDIRLTNTYTRVVGFDNSSTDVTNSSYSKTIIQEAINAMNVSNPASGGAILIRSGYHLISSDTGDSFLNFAVLNQSVAGYTLRGESLGTVLIQNNSNSGILSLGSAANLKKNIIIEDLNLYGVAESLKLVRLLNGNPSDDNTLEKVFIHRIIAGEDGSNVTRLINLDGQYVFIDQVVVFNGTGLYGGSGGKKWIYNNVLVGRKNRIASEVECMDINGADPNAFVYANFLENCYEQIIDSGARYGIVVMNFGSVNIPTDQGGFTISNDFAITSLNVVVNTSNSRGGIEHHAGADWNTYIGNIIVTNDTNYTGHSDFSNTAARCMRMDGKNGTFVGNLFKGCNTPFTTTAANVHSNQLWGNWFEPTASIDEKFVGINSLGGQLVAQGQNMNISRNLSIGQNLQFVGYTATTFPTCSTTTAGTITYNTTGDKFMGCNATAWVSL